MEEDPDVMFRQEWNEEYGSPIDRNFHEWQHVNNQPTDSSDCHTTSPVERIAFTVA